MIPPADEHAGGYGVGKCWKKLKKRVRSANKKAKFVADRRVITLQEFTSDEDFLGDQLYADEAGLICRYEELEGAEGAEFEGSEF